MTIQDLINDLTRIKLEMGNLPLESDVELLLNLTNGTIEIR